MKKLFRIVSILFIFFFIHPYSDAQDINKIIRGGDLELLKKTLEKNPSLLAAKDFQENTLLHTAAQAGKADIVTFLLEEGISVNTQNRAGYTALHFAVLENNRDIVEILLNRGADPNMENVYLVTPLILAIGGGNLDILELLHSNGAVIESNNIRLLHFAIINKQEKAADYLIANGLTIPTKGKEGQIFLHNAAKMGLEELVNRMIDEGSDIKSINPHGGSLLHSAAFGGLANLVKSLIKEGLSLNLRDKYGFTPLHFAALNGMIEIISIMNKQGAEINPVTVTGKTPLDIAILNKQEKTVEQLETLGAVKYSDKKKQNTARDKAPEIIWKNSSDSPVFTRNMGAAVIGGSIFVVGGYGSANEVSSSNLVYNVDKNIWETKGDMLTPRSNLAVVALNNEIYAIGGNSGMPKNEVFDPDSNKWDLLSPLPTPRMHLNGAAAVLDKKIFVIGGVEEWWVVSDKNEVFDPETNSWQVSVPMPTPRQSAVLAAAEGKIFVFGGNGEYMPLLFGLTVVEAFDPSANIWVKKADIPEPGFPVGAVVVENRIFLLIQTGFGSEESSKIYVYNPKKDTWSDAVSVPRTVRLAGFTAFENKIFITGGGNSREIFTDILIGEVKELNQRQ